MTESVTVLLDAHRNGDASAMDRLAALLFPELKQVARRRAGSGRGSGATTLVQETFVKLLSGGSIKARDRQQFFALAATIMRQIIVDEIRYFTANKRAGNEVTLTQSVIGADSHEKALFLLQVNQMLEILEAEDSRLARVFECRYFAGLPAEETATALDTSTRSAERLWSEARARIAALIEQDNA